MKLFKYHKISEYTIDALKQRMWWFSNPQKYNDPFEFRLRVPDEESVKTIKNIETVKGWLLKELGRNKISFELDNGEIIRGHSLSEYFNQAEIELQLLQEVVQHYQEEVYKLGVASFTESNDDILMWSHYAEFHSGFCLEFDINGADQTFFNKVIYSTEYPGLDFLEFPDFGKMFNKQLITKSPHWSYEKEVRCIRTDGNRLHPYFGKLRGIIFGAKTREDDKEKIKDIFKGEKMTFYQAKMHSMQYQLIIEELGSIL